MKSYIPLIASLFLLSASCSSSVAEIEAHKIAQSTEISDRQTEPIATEIDPHIKDNIAPEISVKVNSAENGGSGVIIAQSDNTYLVLTNKHVLRSQTEFTIDTHDGETYQAIEVESAIATGDDLALLQFKSDQEYQTATINTAATPQAEQTILAVGYSAETGELVKETGKIERIPNKTLKEGYSIGYTSNIVQGMSGGAILNTNGEVIGINGKSAFPIINSGYDREDGTKPSAEEIEQYRQLSWGLSINRLLAQINSEIITAYSLPIPETPDNIETPVLTGWLGELEAKAKQISVRIDSSSGANGSGVIIAKEGNTYTVLTADHVLCEKDDDNKCIGYDYEITTPDGETYTLDANTVKAEAGVDLATFKFTSNESYQVAQLADYPIQALNAVFVAGYPKLGANTPPQWQFSLGYGLEKEQGLLSVNVSSNSSGKESSAAISQSSLAGGYEMVYTSPTYGGMSGGAVLDKDGRVIGIHGQAEGETTIDSRGGASNKIQMGYSLGIPISTFIGLKARLGVGEILSVGSNAPAELNPREQEVLRAAILGTEISDSNATAKRWLERGNQLWRLKRYSEAVQAFDRAIELQPEFIHLAYYGKGRALVYIEEDELALASLEQAIKYNPKFALAFLYQSAVLQKVNRLEKAFFAIEKALLLQKDDANLYSQKGVILQKLKQYSNAEVAFTQAIKIDARSAFYNNRGFLFYEQGKLELALADYNRSLEINPQFADAYNKRSVVYAQQGKLELALADLNRALEINPKFTEAYYNRGTHYYEQGKLKLALVDLNRALETNPDYANAYVNRALVFQKQEKLELALADLNRALEINPEFAQAYYNRGVFYYDQGKLELALSDYNQAIKLNPEDVQAYSNRAVLHREQGELELALADRNQIIKLNPEDADAYINRGFLYHTKGELAEALSDYNQAIKFNPQSVKAYVSLGLLYKQMGNIAAATSNLQKAQQLFLAQNNTAGAEAIADILKTLEQTPTETAANTNRSESVDPEDAPAYNNRALNYHRKQEYGLALSNYNQAIKLNPQLAEAYNNRGVLYKEQGEIKLALSDYNQAIKLNSQFAEAYNNRGLLYKEQGEIKLALSDYNQAIKLNSQFAAAHYNRGLLYKEQGKLELAIADYEQAIEFNPEYAEAYANSGLLYEKRGDIAAATSNLQKAQQLFLAQNNTAGAEAIADILKTLEQTPTETAANTNRSESVNPEDAQAYYDRAFEYHQQQEYDRALADYSKVIELDRSNEKAFINRGLVYHSLGKDEDAIADYNKAIEINPNNSASYRNRGVVYFQQGKYELAETDWDKAIAINPEDALAYYNRGLLYLELSDSSLAKTDLETAKRLAVLQENTNLAEKAADALQ